MLCNHEQRVVMFGRGASVSARVLKDLLKFLRGFNICKRTDSG